MISIINVHYQSDPDSFYIGRSGSNPSPLANPYSHLPHTKADYKVANRTIAINKYRSWLYDQIENQNKEVIDELERLCEYLALRGGLVLSCHCVPSPCHGEVIIEVIKKALESA